MPDLSTVNPETADELRPPLGLKTPLPGVEVQYYLTPEGFSSSSTFCSSRILVKKVRAACSGEVLLPDVKKLSPAPRHFALILQHVLGKLGGSSVTCYELTPVERKPARTGRDSDAGPKTAEEVDLGFDYIAKHAPTAIGANEHLKWIQKQRLDKSSPVCDWKESLLKEAIHNLASARNFAVRIEDYPLTLRHLSNWTLMELNDIVPCLRSDGGKGTFKSKSFWFVGESGKGKTPLCFALANAISQYWIEDQASGAMDEAPRAHFKSGSRNRDEKGDRKTPYVLDDP
eukprot:1671677-Amphidinium_carterae.1